MSLSFVLPLVLTASTPLSAALDGAYSVWSCHLAQEAASPTALNRFQIAFSPISEREVLPAYFETDDPNGLLGGEKANAIYRDRAITLDGSLALHARFATKTGGTTFDIIASVGGAKSAEMTDTAQGWNAFVVITKGTQGSNPEGLVYTGTCYISGWQNEAAAKRMLSMMADLPAREMIDRNGSK